MRFYIDDARRHPEIRSVGFTGGEPFLYYDEMLQTAEYAKKAGLSSTVNTNGFWGRDPETWGPRLAQLKEAGVETIAISSDRFHQEYVPLKDAVSAVRLCKKAGISAAIMMITVPGTTDQDMETMRAELGEDLKDVPVSPSSLLPAGKAASLDENCFRKLDDPANALCTFDGSLHISYDGHVYMCCSQLSREIPFLDRGIAGQVTIQDIYNI